VKTLIGAAEPEPRGSMPLLGYGLLGASSTATTSTVTTAFLTWRPAKTGRPAEPDETPGQMVPEARVPLLAASGDDFYEEDEPVEDVLAAFERGEKHLTGPPKESHE